MRRDAILHVGKTSSGLRALGASYMPDAAIRCKEFIISWTCSGISDKGIVALIETKQVIS
jgi:hypothetical protein